MQGLHKRLFALILCLGLQGYAMATSAFQTDAEITEYKKGCVSACAENPDDLDLCKKRCQCSINHMDEFMSRDELIELGSDTPSDEANNKADQLADFCVKEHPRQN